MLSMLTTHSLFRRTPLDEGMHAHMGDSGDIPDMDSEPGKSKWQAQGDLEEMPIEVI